MFGGLDPGPVKLVEVLPLTSMDSGLGPWFASELYQKLPQVMNSLHVAGGGGSCVPVVASCSLNRLV